MRSMKCNVSYFRRYRYGVLGSIVNGLEIRASTLVQFLVRCLRRVADRRHRAPFWVIPFLVVRAYLQTHFGLLAARARGHCGSDERCLWRAGL